MRNARNIDRELVMCEMFRAGKTLQAIADEYGLTRERVRQLISRHGLTGCSGGSFKTNLPKRIAVIVEAGERKRAREDRRYEMWLECSKATFMELTGGLEWNWMIQKTGKAAHPGVAFIAQKRNAKKRGIAWNLSFPEWWRIWLDSGKWDMRGRGAGYCMARQGDSGAYAADNIYICTIGQNCSDSYLVKPWHERFPSRGGEGRL